MTILNLLITHKMGVSNWFYFLLYIHFMLLSYFNHHHFLTLIIILDSFLFVVFTIADDLTCHILSVIFYFILYMSIRHFLKLVSMITLYKFTWTVAMTTILFTLEMTTSNFYSCIFYFSILFKSLNFFT